MANACSLKKTGPIIRVDAQMPWPALCAMAEIIKVADCGKATQWSKAIAALEVAFHSDPSRGWQIACMSMTS
jgi:hypothetical protein